MKLRDYTSLKAEMARDYARHAPTSAALHERALRRLIDGGSHTLRLMQPFPPCFVSGHGAWVEDEDGHRILDFWQGHFTNILGHNPPVVTEALSRGFRDGYGLQSGFVNRAEVEVAELLCERTGTERVRFTTSGALATMNALILARVFTGRDIVMKVGGGWHGGQPFALRGVSFKEGFEHTESGGLPPALTDNTVLTGFNDLERLHDDFRRYGDRLAAFIVEPIIGAGGMIPARRAYLQAARDLTRKHGALLVFDEVIAGFRFRAGNAGALYDVEPDLMTLGKIIGGGMPVAAVAGRTDVMELAGRAGPVKFEGGTYSAHPACILAARMMLSHLVENEADIYPKLALTSRRLRSTILAALTEEGISARFAGDRSEILPDNSLHLLVFPRVDGLALDTPDEVLNPACCDREMSEKVFRLALMLENVHTVHGVGSISTAHTDDDIDFMGEACRRAAHRVASFVE